MEFDVVTGLGLQAHNASPLRARNGSWLLFHIGSGGGSGSSFLHHSESPAGPWHPLPALDCNNPAPMYDSPAPPRFPPMYDSSTSDVAWALLPLGATSAACCFG